MTTATANLGEIAAFWRAARRLYTIYSELNRTFEIHQPLCSDLEYPVDRSEPEVIERVRQWFEQMDARIQVWQVRQLLQSTNLQTEENLRLLILRHLEKKQKTEIDRDKADFLLVQYFAHCAPHGPYEQATTLQEVARVMEPVLGKCPEKFPDWAEGLDRKLDTLNHCDSLEELQKSGALTEVREMKLALGDNHVDVAALVALTRFNFLARRAFFRAMHLDLHAIRNVMNELESRGQTVIDGTEAGLTERESLEHIRHLVHQWKTPFRAPYTGGASFQQLILLRHALQHAIENGYNIAMPEAVPQAEVSAVAQAAAAPAPERPQKKPVAPEPQPAPAKQASSPVTEPAAAPAKEISPSLKKLQDNGYLEQCLADITEQLKAMPPKKGASVTAISLAGCKLLIATWEAEAYTMPNGPLEHSLQRAVAARTILHVCVERHKKHEPTDLFAALEIAHLAVEEMRQQVAQAKEEKNIDGAVNLAATTKRLLALIEQAEKLCQ